MKEILHSSIYVHISFNDHHEPVGWWAKRQGCRPCWLRARRRCRKQTATSCHQWFNVNRLQQFAINHSMCVTMELKFGNYEKEKKTINEYSLKPDLKPGDVCWVCRASDCTSHTTLHSELELHCTLSAAQCTVHNAVDTRRIHYLLPS